jgi:glycerol-3-phosphate dehydrogenase subunit C
MDKDRPESLAQAIVEWCSGCECCRTLMDDTSCLVFAELFRLSDREREMGTKATSQELRALIDLCNFCGICPCTSVRIDMRESKDAFIERDGLKPAIHILEDVQRVSDICGAYPRLANLLLQKEPSATLLKRIAGVHPERTIPKFPEESFIDWAKGRGIDKKRGGKEKKVAYFAGCTAQFLFPQVAKAAVEVLEHNGIEVYYPEQKCCGMPPMLEGDRRFTFELAAFNLQQLGETVDAGYDIVCSCPTCGYTLKNLLTEGTYFSAGCGYIGEAEIDSAGLRATDSRRKKLASASKLADDGLLLDEGYFASLDVQQRIKVASRTYDLGEYLRDLHRSGKFKTDLGPAPERMAYYPPCHLREQKIGEPWWDLLGLVPEISIQKAGDSSDCCGIAGIMGFKREFYDVSVAMGSRLMEKIRTINPERLLSDCLSCRIQFNQLLSYKVSHPVEILREAYSAY